MKPRRIFSNIQAVLAFVLLGMGVGITPAGARPEEHRKIALLVGVSDNIQAMNRLMGPSNDVPAMRQMLIENFGFKPENITVLMDRQATRSGILQAFEERLIRPVKPGDLVFFYYSGHGTLVPAIHPETEPTGQDSALCPYDAVDVKGLIIDDEIGALIDRIPTDEVACVVDACCSGTANREGRIVRTIPAARFGVRSPLSSPEHRKEKLAAPLSRDGESDRGKECYIGAAGDEQEAESDYFLADRTRDRPDERDVMGALTYYLLQAVREDVNHALTYSALVDRVRALLKSNGYAQVPEAHGADVDRKRFLQTSEAPPAPPAPDHVVTVAAEVEAVQEDTITVRSLAGAPLQVGSILETVKSRKWHLVTDEVKRTSDTSAAQVAAVHGLRADCRRLKGDFSVGQRMVETFHALGAGRLRAALTGDRAAAGDLERTLADLPAVEVVAADAPHDVELAISRAASGAVVVSPYRGSLPLPALTVADTPRLVENLAAVQALAQLSNSSPPFHVRLTVDGQAGAAVTQVGRTVAIEVSCDADAYLYIIDAAADGKISGVPKALYVQAGVTLRLPPIPVRPPAGLDTIKVIATTHPLSVQLTPKTDENSGVDAAAKAARDILDQLTEGINKTSGRDLDFSGLADGVKPISIEGWTVETLSLRIDP